MKKLIIGAALAAASPLATADTILGLYVGADSWQAQTSGAISTNDSLQNYKFDDSSFTNFYAALEHPVPLVPNVKVKYNQLELDGSFSGAIKFGDTEFGLTPSGNTITADLSHIDYVFYYEIFDNDLFSIDLGVAGKQFDGDITMSGAPMVNGQLTDALMTETVAFSGIVPVGYAAIEVVFPFTGLSAFAEGSMLAIDDNEVRDYQVGLAWEFIDNMAVDMALKVGYRSLIVELDDFDDVYSDLEVDGFFAGVQVHF